MFKDFIFQIDFTFLKNLNRVNYYLINAPLVFFQYQ